MGIYEDLGLKTIVNARGCITPFGGSIMPPEVIKAMAEAAPYFVDIIELNRKIGEFIAEITGAEAGYVTSGGSAGILLSTAALITGDDLSKIHKLPETSGMANEVIVHRSQRHSYDHAVRAAGGVLVEIGHSYRTSSWELEAAINDQTVGIFYTDHPFLRRGFLPLNEVIDIAHTRGVPVYVDAASSLPPAENLQRFIGLEADLVFYSGGKAIMGPQSSGLICGRKDLIKAVELNGSPNLAIGRSAKVCKEEMIGLMVALKSYIQRDHKADLEQWLEKAEYIAETISKEDFPGISTRVVFDEEEDSWPETHIRIKEDILGFSARTIEKCMFEGEPCIAAGIPLLPHTVTINPHMLRDGEEYIVATRLVEVISKLYKDRSQPS